MIVVSLLNCLWRYRHIIWLRISGIECIEKPGDCLVLGLKVARLCLTFLDFGKLPIRTHFMMIGLGLLYPGASGDLMIRGCLVGFFRPVAGLPFLVALLT